MSSIKHLEADLALLSNECKRRNLNIRLECDVAVAVLKNYPPDASVEALNDSQRRLLAAPLVSTLASNNTKLVTISILAINRLAGTTAFSTATLGPLLDGLLEASHLAMDIQLRILQCLPPLMQNYIVDIRGKLLLRLLQIGSGLTAANKPAVVINTAAATLQQLFGYIYERNEKYALEAVPEKTEKQVHEVKIEDKVTYLDDLSYEGYLIFKDLCNILNESPASFLGEGIPLKPLSSLEFIHTVINNQRNLFTSRPDLVFLFKDHLVPSLLHILNSPAKSFPYFVRCLRVIQCLLMYYVDKLEVESEVLLSFLNHLLLDNEHIPQDWATKSLLWDKILVLETLLGIFTNFKAILTIYEKFDISNTKKNVLLEMLNTLQVFISHNSHLVTESLETITANHPPSDYISKKSSSLRVAMLDHLDKTEPPTTIPQTYSEYLTFSIILAYSDGVVKFISRLSSDSSDWELKFITDFIKDGHQHIYPMFKTFVYSRMDGETFHILIRSLQKLVHSTGLLGLTAERDQMLSMIAHAVIENGPSESKNLTPSASNTLLDQGKQLLNYGESLVESLTSTLVQNGAEEQKERSSRYSRRFNARQVVCLRALINLAISLGSTLKESWDIVYTTFQWCNYYLHGADEFSLAIKTNNDSGKTRGSIQRLEDMPKLSAQDISTIDNLKLKLLESFGEYPEESFANVLNSLIRLSDTLFGRKEPNGILGENHTEAYESIGLCPYNKLYFFNQVVDVCRANASRFAVDSISIWETVAKYITELGKDRTLNYNLRIHIVDALDSIVGSIAEGGFSLSKEEVSTKTANMTLDCLVAFLNSIFDAGTTSETLVVNCETEIHLKVLSTVHGLIDKYDSFYQHTWKQVFNIINTPFVTGAVSESKDSNLNEKKAQLINYAFETLKLILDEFLENLPSNQLRMVTDTLFNFSEQQYDLNISFSSVSCFWIIGDSIKSKIEQAKPHGSSTQISTEKDLILYLCSENDETKQYFMNVDVYLLLVLARVCGDNRARVRDGAIQTFFQIVDVHGSSNFDWKAIYDIALPSLLNVDIDPQDLAFIKPEWLESLSLTFTGFENVYDKFVTTNQDSEVYWEGILNYFTRLLKHRWVDLDLKIIKSYDELLSLLLKRPNVSLNLRDLFYRFWVSVSIEYDFINPLYQNFLASFCESYIHLNQLIEDIIDEEKISRILHALSHCARYPVLPNRVRDEDKPSALQNAVLNNLRCIKSKKPIVQSAVVQQLAAMTVFPFGVKSRIEQRVAGKLNGTANLPTFHALSRSSMQLLGEKLEGVEQLGPLVSDNGILRVLRSLIEMIKQKPVFTGTSGSGPIWLEAENLVRLLVQRLTADNGAMIDNSGNAEAYWNIILQALDICFEVGDNPYESNIIEQYKLLSSDVFPVLLEKKGVESLIDDFLHRVFEVSFLYLSNDIEDALRQKDEKELDWVVPFAKRLCEYDFASSIGTTMDPQAYNDSQVRLMCLTELCSFAQKDYKRAKQMLVCRAAFCLRRFVADERLLYRAPLPKIQQQELFIILDALVKIVLTNDEFGCLQLLLVEAIPYASRIEGLAVLLQQVLQLAVRTK